MSEKKPLHILLSSTLATTVVAALTNPLDVLKVRVQSQSKDCTQISQTKCVGHSHTRPAANSISQASLYRLIMTPNLEKHYKILCDCLPFRSNTKALIYIIRKEGARTLTNGLLQGLMGSVLSTATYFFCYEEVRKQVKNITSHPVGIPLLSAMAARTITTCVSFPFEYWRTLQQSVTGVNDKAGFKLGMKVNSGFMSLLQRDLLFSGLYWVLVENIRREVKSWRQQNDEGYVDKKNLILSNVIAGGLSGAIAAFVTLPLDVVKTRRQLYPKEYKNRSTYNILRGIYVKEGSGALVAGMRQRVAKVTMACAGILTLYEFFSDMMREITSEE